MKSPAIAGVVLALMSLWLSGCNQSESFAETDSHPHESGEGESGHHHVHKLVVTSPVKKDVITTQQYVCQIHSCQHIEVCALEGGYLEEIHVREGQEVKRGDLMFKILPILYQAKVASEVAEANRIQIELTNAESLSQKGIVSAQQIALKQAELAKAQANVELARAELSFTEVKAPFDGIVDRQMSQLGSLIEEGDVLTTLSDNSTMWVYFNVPEARYLEYKTELDKVQQAEEDDGDDEAEVDDDDDDGDDDDDDGDDDDDDREVDGSAQANLQIELKLANGQIFPQHGEIGAIEADFNNETGNIAFRADFPNPDRLLRNGQTGTILIHRPLKDAIVIPQRATYEILAQRYAFVVGEDNVVRQRDITVAAEQDDIFVIESGLVEGDKIVLEGIRQVRDGDKVEYEFAAPDAVFADLKHHAE